MENYSAVTTRCREPYARAPLRATLERHDFPPHGFLGALSWVKPLVTQPVFPSRPERSTGVSRTAGRVAPLAATMVPMETPRAAAAVYAALAAADTSIAGATARHPNGRAARARRITKPLLMPALARAFATSTSGDRTPLRQATLVAQGLSGVGDVALLGKGDPALLTGLGAFLGAHAAYVCGFASARDARDAGSRRGTRAAATLFVVAGPAMGWAAGRTSPRLRVPVVTYAGALCAMAATASRLGPRADPTARRTLIAGTTLFLVSDSTLGAREFLDDGSDDRRRQALDVLVMATYTVAQGLIAAGVARAVRAAHPTQEAGTSRT